LIIGPAPGIFAFGKYTTLKLFQFEARCLIFFQGVEVIQASEKQKICDLLDDFERIGNATRPEGVPDAVNLVADSSGEHVTSESGFEYRRHLPVKHLSF
jgi:hypothetical protein